MFRVKVCGVCSSEDAETVVAAGADAIGLNFFPGSKRFVDPETARRIVENIAGRAYVVGVFVNATVEEMVQASERLPLDCLQLHGDESAVLAWRSRDRT